MSTLKLFAQALTRPNGSLVAELFELVPTGLTLIKALEAVALAADRAGEFNTPYLHQDISDDMATTWEGQPVVWDGSFTKRFWTTIYTGYSGPNGQGPIVSRVVRPTDRISLTLIRNTADQLDL